MKKYIKNFEALAKTKDRNDLLEIIESAYQYIDTDYIIKKNVKLDNNILIIKDKIFNLEEFSNLYLIGFGKASSKAILALEKIIGDRVTGGIVMDEKIGECMKVKQYVCTHPKPSKENIPPSQELMELANKLNEKDLALVVVSGGGSSMLCWPESECEQGITLYDEFLKSGGNITELNTIRKHLSLLKGGGLAKLLYPATVSSLVFCDVPGDLFEEVASGPTYKDTSTVEDALKIINKYNLSLQLTLNETPKEDIYFEKVYNIPLVTNNKALEGMELKASELGYNVINIGSDLYEDPDSILKKFKNNIKNNSVVIGAGEPSIIIKNKRGRNGRCEYVSIKSLNYITEKDVFSSFASDGIDNLSSSAGAVVDNNTKIMLEKENLNVERLIEENLIEDFFIKSKDQIITGETESNVSDLMIMLRK